MLVLFVIMGFVAGLINVVRAARKAQADMAASLAATPSVEDDDEETTGTGIRPSAAEGANGAAHHSPMEQFQIKRLIPIDLFGVDASFTNSSLFMVMAVGLITAFLILAMGRRQLVPGRLQSMAELSYEYIANMVRENLGEEGMKYFPWVFTIFMFILTLNLLGHGPTRSQ